VPEVDRLLAGVARATRCSSSGTGASSPGKEGRTMLKLYHCPQTRSIRPLWLLGELDVPHEIETISLQAGDNRKPEYLKLNPNGTVPTLVDGDLVLWESAAICQYLADKFPDKGLAPVVGTLFLHSVRLPEAERIPQLVETARAQLAAAIGVVDGALAGREWILGAQFTAADVMVGSTLAWAQMMGMIGAGTPNVSGYLARCSARPAMQRATAS
jgi:glutathione S-transferase